MRIFTLVLGILLISSISFAADIDGVWSGEMQQMQFGGFGRGGRGGGNQAPRVLTFSFKADGETLTGYSMPQGMNIQVPIRDGIIKGNKIWYLVDVNFGGSKMVIRYKGKVKGDKIKLSFKTVNEGQAGGGFMMGETQVTLKRQ